MTKATPLNTRKGLTVEVDNAVGIVTYRRGNEIDVVFTTSPDGIDRGQGTYIYIPGGQYWVNAHAPEIAYINIPD